MPYTDTFITVAPDSLVEVSVVPTMRGNKKTAHLIQYELLVASPYQLTHEDLLYEVHIRHKGFSEEEIAERGDEIRAELLSKERACLRASALTKKYGWGAHYNDEKKIALFAMESAEYQQFVAEKQGTKQLKPAMRSSRKKK